MDEPQKCGADPENPGVMSRVVAFTASGKESLEGPGTYWGPGRGGAEGSKGRWSGGKRTILCPMLPVGYLQLCLCQNPRIELPAHRVNVMDCQFNEELEFLLCSLNWVIWGVKLVLQKGNVLFIICLHCKPVQVTTLWTHARRLRGSPLSCVKCTNVSVVLGSQDGGAGFYMPRPRDAGLSRCLHHSQSSEHPPTRAPPNTSTPEPRLS